MSLSFLFTARSPLLKPLDFQAPRVVSVRRASWLADHAIHYWKPFPHCQRNWAPWMGFHCHQVALKWFAGHARPPGTGRAAGLCLPAASPLASLALAAERCQTGCCEEPRRLKCANASFGCANAPFARGGSLVGFHVCRPDRTGHTRTGQTIEGLGLPKKQA